MKKHFFKSRIACRWFIFLFLMFGCSPHVEDVAVETELLKEKNSEALFDASAKPFEGFDEVSIEEKEVESSFMNIEADEEGLYQKKYTISVKDAHLDEILSVVAEELGVSLVIDPNVQKKVRTAILQDVTFPQLFYALLTPLGATYSRSDSLIHVYKRRHRSVIFQINYIFQMSSQSSEEDNSGGAKEMVDFWEQIDKQLGLILKVEDSEEQNLSMDVKPYFYINSFAGTVLVHAPDFMIDSVREYLKSAVESALRQVTIRVQFIELRIRNEDKFAVNWKNLSQDIFGVDTVRTDYNTIGNLGSTGQKGNLLSFIFDSKKTDVVINALRTSGELVNNENQIVTTLNNHSATFKQVEKRTFFQIKKSQVTQNQITTDSYEADRNQVEIGLNLKIIPQISKNGEVIMQVLPSNTDLIQIQTISDPDGNFLASDAELNDRNLSTVVRVPHGKTVLLGGLKKTNNFNEEKGLPLLKDIPFLGHLFRSTETKKEKTVLYLFITPIVNQREHFILSNKLKKSDVGFDEHETQSNEKIYPE